MFQTIIRFMALFNRRYIFLLTILTTKQAKEADDNSSMRVKL